MADETVNSEATERVNPFKAEAEAANKERADKKGTRVFVGFTRGKGSLPIKWEAFDTSLPNTNPASIAEFMELTGRKEEKDLLEYLIVGFNDDMYTQASDPIAEHVNPAWDKDTVLQFRLVVRNLSKAMNKSIEDIVTMIKPGVELAFLAKSASK